MSSRLLSGRYELLEKIGDGGMAVVYKGRDRLLNRYIAVKILRPEFTKDATFVENFKRESQAAAGLSHPNIVGVYDVGREGNINYIVMELIEGRTLNEVIEQEAPMDYRKVIDISKQVASALRIAHKNKIIHRDVKPHNIMITEDGVVKLADFGIARAVNDATLSTGSKIVGSVHYFSPEQARGNYVDERSDIYSLGIVMYEMLTGRVPFDGENPVQVALKHINDEITPPGELVAGIPPSLERCVMKATSKYQTNRYSNAEELIEELDNISFVTNVAGTTIFASSDVIEKNSRRRNDAADRDDEADDTRKRKGKKKALIITLVAVLLLAFAGWFTAWKLGVFSPTKPAPELRDMTFAEAKSEAEEQGFKIKKGKELYSNEYAEGRICRQNPHPGDDVQKGGTITVNISKGSKAGMVPNIIGMSDETVEEYLNGFGYSLGYVKSVVDPSPAGTILNQDPAAGTPLDKESKINIWVSDGTGKEKGTVPSVTGQSLKKAESLITEAGFELGRVTYEFSESTDKGYIMWQQYQANSLLEKGTTIDIQVSKGPEPEPEPEPEPDPDDHNGDDSDDSGESDEDSDAGSQEN